MSAPAVTPTIVATLPVSSTSTTNNDNDDDFGFGGAAMGGESEAAAMASAGGFGGPVSLVPSMPVHVVATESSLTKNTATVPSSQSSPRSQQRPGLRGRWNKLGASFSSEAKSVGTAVSSGVTKTGTVVSSAVQRRVPPFPLAHKKWAHAWPNLPFFCTRTTRVDYLVQPRIVVVVVVPLDVVEAVQRPPPTRVAPVVNEFRGVLEPMPRLGLSGIWSLVMLLVRYSTGLWQPALLRWKDKPETSDWGTTTSSSNREKERLPDTGSVSSVLQ